MILLARPPNLVSGRHYISLRSAPGYAVVSPEGGRGVTIARFVRREKLAPLRAHPRATIPGEGVTHHPPARCRLQRV
jgi:hypothetical protein